MKEALERIDALMNQLVEADQTGSGMDPLRVASELGKIKQLLAGSPATIPTKGGQSHPAEPRSIIPARGAQKHHRCEACGTVVHGAEVPVRCPTCGGERFFAADIEQPFVESGAG